VSPEASKSVAAPFQKRAGFVPSRFTMVCTGDVDQRIIIGDAAIGIARAAFDKGIGFGPVCLDVTSGDGSNSAASAEFTGIAPEKQRVAVFDTKTGSVFRVHQDIVAPGAGQRVAITLDHAVELLASAGREAKDDVGSGAIDRRPRWGPDGRRWSGAIDRRFG